MKIAKYYFLIIILSIIPLYTLYTTDRLIHTHDGLMHLARIAAYYKALGDFQFPVRWAGDLNYGYGMPLFNFMYQLPYILSSIFLFFGLSLVNSFKIVLGLSYLLAGIFMFAFAKSFLGETKKAFLITIFYQFATFRFVDLLIRGSIGEDFTYTFLPLVLLGLTLLLKKINYKNIIITVLGSTLLILSHNALSLVFFIISTFFIFFFFKNKKQLFWGSLSLILGLMIAAFYWMPALFEHQFTYGDLFMKDMYLKHFPPLQNFFIPNLLNSPSLWVGGVSVQLGIFHTLAVFLSLIIILSRINKFPFLYFKVKKLDIKTQKLFIISLVLFFIAVFFMQPISKIFWEKISFLRQFQFPWRLLALTTFASSILSVSFFNLNIFNKKPVYIIFVFLVIFSSFAYWKSPEGFDRVNENYYWNYPLDTTYFGETNVIWSAGPAGGYPKQRAEVIGGKAEIKEFYKKSQLQTFVVDARTKAQIVNHTQYFPGWRVYSNGKPVPIEFQDMNWRGQITFYLSPGINNVKLVFEESKIRFISDMISLSGVVILLLLFIMRKKFNEIK